MEISRTYCISWSIQIYMLNIHFDNIWSKYDLTWWASCSLERSAAFNFNKLSLVWSSRVSTFEYQKKKQKPIYIHLDRQMCR